ncbi:MAG: hypothetical protein JNL60_11870 [Bacteroidia bacterium]|nr:hypothetical protein [Bacteroidia bacterium]
MEKYRENKKTKRALRLLYFSVFIIAISGLLTAFSFSRSPAKTIIGGWEECAWEYEKVNKLPPERNNYRDISDEVKDLIGQKLSIHTSETWLFLPNGKLVLYGPQGHRIIKWKLNGRGHVLELRDEDRIENYNITELNDSSMVINFDTDMEVRGIARLTFARKHKHHDLEIQ